MKELLVRAASGDSRIVIGGALADMERYADLRQKLIIADEEVARRFRSRLPAWPLVEIKGGEEAKALKVVERLYREFLALELDRSALVLGIGGGTVCDLAGFAAATYNRGLRLALMPTTLLAQVDASIGGKNGVNFGGYKNLIGTIRQPETVYCDPAFLKTIPPREIRSGLAEIIKAGAICDAALFEFLEKDHRAALALEPAALEHALYAALKVKAAIVEADETERGDRMKLNFGHTIGHAVESTEHLAHGEAVSVGMVAEAGISRVKCGLAAVDVARLQKLLSDCGLPTESAGRKTALFDAIRRDKKRRGAVIKMPLLQAIGSSQIVEVSLDELEGVLDDLCQCS